MSIAFFDLDRTLIDINSGTLWLKSERRAGRIPLHFYYQASWWLFKYHLGMSNLESALLSAIYTLKGQSEAAMIERVSQFYHQEVRDKVRPEARTVIEQHRQLGDDCLLLTSASSYLSAHFLDALHLDGGAWNSFEVIDGHFTGKPLGSLCYGAGKVEYAEKAAKQRGVSLTQCSFYTDSYSDLPLLQKVGKPVVVCPDRKLRAEAKRNHWTCLDWSRSSEVLLSTP